MSVFDRDAARDALFDAHPAEWEPRDAWVEELLDALEARVRPAPPQTIDRDALRNLLWMAARHGEQPGVTADSVLALLRPVAE